MSTYLIKGASLLGERVADILIEDGKIARIGQDIEAADAQVVDASGQIALPGPGRYSYSPGASPEMRLLKPLRPVLARRL